jgi:predicted amidophosphoribosyltransferase
MEDLVAKFLSKHFNGYECDSCHRAFPKSLLINYNSSFPEVDGLYCTLCMHKVYDLLGYCDECGEEYPKKHLYKCVFDNSIICKRCLQNESDS